MPELNYLQKELIRAYFKRTKNGILPDHIIPALEKSNNYETMLTDAQRYLSDLFFARQANQKGF